MHEQSLVALLAEMTRPEELARKALAEHRAEVERLHRALADQRPSLARRLLRLPLIDALGRPLAVEQLWLPDLTINYNFRQVARFDRCTTCHLGIDKTAAGSTAEPAYLGEEAFEIELATPEGPGKSAATAEGTTPATLAEV
jgi:hypothetical protein